MLLVELYFALREFNRGLRSPFVDVGNAGTRCLSIRLPIGLGDYESTLGWAVVEMREDLTSQMVYFLVERDDLMFGAALHAYCGAGVTG